MDNNKLIEDLVHGLKVLEKYDRDLRSLTIFCNAKFSKGTDTEVSDKLKDILKTLISKGEVKRDVIKINHRDFKVYSLA